jgi:DNA-binding transcriptional MocR family regulator
MYLTNSLQNQNIKVVNLENMFLADFRRENFIRLSICKADQAQIERGLSVIGKTMNTFSNKNIDQEQIYSNQLI